ncbi:MAG: serine hydrolase [Eubacterium sp.]|nr:serine hydrolase [Eubacterium sp.]
MSEIKKILCLVLALAFVFSGCSVLKRNTDKSTTEHSTEATSAVTTETTTADSRDTALEAVIKSHVPDDNGDWAVYCKNLKTGQYTSINNKKMVSASVIKLFIMATVYDQINKGKLQDTDEIESLMEQMITVSHNESSNKLVAITANGDFKEGMKNVNAYAQSIDCPDTEQQRDMRDSRPKPIPQQNYTSVDDVGKLLEMIYNKECVSEKYDQKMLDYMLQQQRTWKIPEGLPKGTKVANKTGELSDTENDVAIVFTDKADYILCVMSNNVQPLQAQESIRNISKAVYDYIIGDAKNETTQTSTTAVAQY